MKLILITRPTYFVEEDKIITTLFDEGLDYLHLRKPDTAPVYAERLLTLIPEKYRKRIVVHGHFYLKEEYNLKGIHLNHRNPIAPDNYTGQISTILGGLHIKMPDSVCDSKLLKKSIEENRKIVREADEKIETVSQEIKRGNYPKEGITWISHLVGLFGQRLWFYGKTQNYTDKLMIHESCIGCGLCATLCPMHNISISNGKAMSGKNCTMCYRCISSCPQKAITLLGKEVKEQCRFEKYY